MYIIYCRSVFSQSQGTGTESLMGETDEITEQSADLSSAWAGKYKIETTLYKN